MLQLLRSLFELLKGKSATGVSANPDPRKALGNRGENHALKLLQQRGHKLVARNVLFKCGELDLVTWHGKTLVFTEVRTRSGTSFGTPAESVNLNKQTKVRRAADAFLIRSFPDGKLPDCRFDVVWLLSKNGEIVEADVIEGAF